MKSSPQSPAGSVSSCGPSPVALHAKWSQSNNDTTKNSHSRSPYHNSPSSKNNADDIDDDLFGSAAWRKKRGKKGAKVASEKDADKQDKDSGRWAAAQLLQERARVIRGQVLVAKEWMVALLRRVASPSLLGRVVSHASLMAFGGTPAQRELNGVVLPTFNLMDLPSGGHELTNEVLVQQARLLCGNYIYHRLHIKGLMNRRVNVAPYQSMVAEELFSAGQELERLYPRVYTDVSRRIAMTMTSAQLVRRALTSVLEGTFKDGITWAKVVSMVVISAAFAEECVVQGHPSFAEDVVMCVGHFVALHLTGWLAQQGGWAAFPTAKPPAVDKPSDKIPILYTSLLLFTFTILFICLFKLFLDFT